MGQFIKHLNWASLTPYNPPLDVMADDPMGALRPQPGEAPAALCTRYTKTLTGPQHALDAQAADRKNPNHAFDNARCHALVREGLATALQDPGLREALQARLPTLVQTLIADGAPMLAATTVVALAKSPAIDLRLPDRDCFLNLLDAVDRGRPESRDGYSGETGRGWHNGGEIANYYRAYFPLALLLVTEPEYELPEAQRDAVLEPYRWRLGLDDWVAAAAPYFAETAQLTNHDPRGFFTPIVAQKLEDAVLAEDYLQDWSSVIDKTLNKIPTVKDKAAELYGDLVGAAYRREQWFTLAEELPYALRMTGASLSDEFVFNAALMVHDDNRPGMPKVIDDILSAAGNFSHLRHAVTSVRRCISLFDAGRYRVYEYKLKHGLRL